MGDIFEKLSDKALKHAIVAGLFARFVRPAMLEHFVGPESARSDLYKGLAGENLSRDEWEAVLLECAAAELARPVAQGVYELHPSLPPSLMDRMVETWGEDGLKTLEFEYMQLYSNFCAELMEDWTGEKAVATVAVEEDNLVRAMGLGMRFEAWMDVLNMARLMGFYLRSLNRGEEWAALRGKILEVIGETLDPGAEIEEAELWIFLVGDDANDDQDQGRLEDAEAQNKKILDYLSGREDEGAKTYRAKTLHQLGVIEHQRGRLPEAEEMFNQALEIFRQTGHAGLTVNTLSMLGVIRIDQDKFAEAVDFLARAYAISLKSGQKTITSVMYQLGRCLEALGEETMLKIFPEVGEGIHPPLHVIRQIMKEAIDNQT